MNEIEKQWADWTARRNAVGTTVVWSGAVLVLFSFLLLFGMTFFLSPHSAPNGYVFASIFVLLLLGIVFLIAGVAAKTRSSLPADMVRETTVIAASGMAQEVISTSDSFMSSALVAVTALGLFFGLVYWWAKYGGIFYILMGGAGLFAALFTLLTIRILFNEQCHTKITIKPSRSISFVNLLTKKVRTYSFDDLDGFLHVELRVSGGRSGSQSVHAITIVKQGMRVESLSSNVYHNFKELQQGLDSLRQLSITQTLPVGYSKRQFLG